MEAEREMEKAVATATATAAAVDRVTAEPTSSRGATDAVKYCSPPGQGNHQSHIGQTSSRQDQESGLVLQPGLTLNAVTQIAKGSNKQIVPSQTNAAYHVMNGNILMPTPIAASGESVIHGANKMMNNFDLKDFENEQDPFENLSLKVINDIEELDKVFLASSRSQSNIGTSSEGEKTSSAESVDLRISQHPEQQNLHQQQDFPSDNVVHANTGAVFPVDGTITSLQEKVNSKNPMIPSTQGAAVFYPSLPCNTALVNYMTSSDTASSSGNSSNAWLHSAHLPVSQNYEARIPDSILAGNLMSSVMQAKHNALTSETYDKSGLRFAVQTPHSVISSSSKQISSRDNGVLYASLLPGHAWPLEANSSPWPPVTTLDYHGPSKNSIHGPLEYDHSRMFCPSNVPLRSAKSNPDLSAVDTTVGASPGWYGRHTPPILDTRSHSKPDKRNIDQVGQYFHRLNTNQISKFNHGYVDFNLFTVGLSKFAKRPIRLNDSCCSV